MKDAPIMATRKRVTPAQALVTRGYMSITDHEAFTARVHAEALGTEVKARTAAVLELTTTSKNTDVRDAALARLEALK